ncbi:MAG: hypothetical protein FJ304_10480 [Planctomycetes bacterium]|nr:hypothetical protein [Planctomycetota bacterium]
MVISPLVVVAARTMSPLQLRSAGAVVGAAGLVGVIALAGAAALTWRPGYGDMTGGAFGRRFVFLWATQTELPVAQCILTGIALWLASVARRATARPIPTTRHTEAP